MVTGVPWYVMLAEGRYKYVRNLIEGEVEELYDMWKDPDELENLCSQEVSFSPSAGLPCAGNRRAAPNSAPFLNTMPKPSTLAIKK